MDARHVLLVSPDYRDTPAERPSLPAGLGIIAQVVAKAGHDVRVCDLNVEGEGDLFRRVGEFCPDVVGIRLISYRSVEACALLARIREALPEALIVAGGPHLTADGPALLRDCPAVDIGVVGEGEETFLEILAGRDPAGVAGVIYRAGGEIRTTGPRPYIADLDALPVPTYEGFRLESYEGGIPIVSSRGCPYRCIFCGAPRILGRKWRKRSAKSMADEIGWWYERGHRHFVFNDSNFAINRERVTEFCRLVKERGWNVDLAADGIRADHLDEEILLEMKSAGFSQLAIGVESASDRVLERLKKGEKAGRIEEAVATATRLGFRVLLFFIIGSPGETVEDVGKSFDLALRYPVENVFFFSMTPIAGTEFHDWALGRGYAPPEPGRYTLERFGFQERLEFTPEGMTPEEAAACIRRAREIERTVRERAGRRARWRRMLERFPGGGRLWQAWERRRTGSGRPAAGA